MKAKNIWKQNDEVDFMDKGIMRKFFNLISELLIA